MNLLNFLKPDKITRLLDIPDYLENYKLEDGTVLDKIYINRRNEINEMVDKINIMLKHLQYHKYILLITIIFTVSMYTMLFLTVDIKFLLIIFCLNVMIYMVWRNILKLLSNIIELYHIYDIEIKRHLNI